MSEFSKSFAPLQEFVEQAAGIDANGYPLDVDNEPAPPYAEELSPTQANDARPRLTLRSPDDILTMRFDDSDIILGDRLLARAQSLVIAAAGGLGKSRLLLQLAAAITTGRKFLHFPTSNPELRWLILQTENSNRRLQDDLSRIRAWLADDWGKFQDRVVIHTMESDTDGLVALDDPAAYVAIADAISESKADVVGFDPLNDFAIGDLNKDADMRLTVTTLSRLVRAGNPLRSPVVLHHAITGRGGAVKVTGYDRASFARNSKALHAWTRAQVNLAPVDPDSNERLIVGCGKCSNGPEFPSFAIRLNPETLIYECDPTVDVKAWERDITGQSNREPLMTPERVAELCRLPMAKAELVHAIREDCGCARQVAYRHVKRAEVCRRIKLNEKTERYSAR